MDLMMSRGYSLKKVIKSMPELPEVAKAPFHNPTKSSTQRVKGTSHVFWHFILIHSFSRFFTISAILAVQENA